MNFVTLMSSIDNLLYQIWNYLKVILEVQLRKFRNYVADNNEISKRKLQYYDSGFLSPSHWPIRKQNSYPNRHTSKMRVSVNTSWADVCSRRWFATTIGIFLLLYSHMFNITLGQLFYQSKFKTVKFVWFLVYSTRISLIYEFDY